MNPLLALLATRPQLLLDHAQAYAALFNEEFTLASAAWRRRVLLQAAAFCSLSVAAVLAGVATMLWCTTTAPASALWFLITIPIAPLLLALVCVLLARQSAPSASFANMSRQINADLAMLRTSGEP
jgi:hypothetical protein